MVERIVIAGAGGQGIVTLGKLIARAAMNVYEFLTFFPSYGAEVRGGASSCQVILSDTEISSPVAEEFDTVIAMSQAAADRFTPLLGAKSLGIINSTLCKTGRGRNVYAIHATKIADQLGNVKAANLVALGAMLARKPVVPPAAMEKHIKQSFSSLPKAIADINLRAFYWGLSV